MAVLGAAAAAGYSIYNDPQMPAFTSSYQDRLGIYNSTSYHAASHTNFWLAVSRRGSTVNCSNLAAGTWKQIMSVTGGGFLGTVVFPRLTNDNWARWTIELTIDGVVTERTTPELVGWNTRRLVFGNMITGADTASLPYVQEYSGRGMTAAGYFDYSQSAGGQVMSTGSAFSAVVPADIQMKRGQPVLKFNTNLTVRIKSTTLACAYGGSNEQFAGALYIINP